MTKRHNNRVLFLAVGVALTAAGAFAQAQDKLAIVTATGDVWARDLSPNSVGAGVRLSGPSLFGGSDDRFVIALGNGLAVVTASGAVWPHPVGNQTVSASAKLGAPIFGGADTRYVLSGDSGDNCGNVEAYVINTRGEVWAHAHGGNGARLSGPSLFGGTNDKYVVLNGARILVINTQGEVWAHDLSSSTPRPPNTFCRGAFDTVGAGHKLAGPGLFGSPDDRYVVSSGNRLLVVNAAGEIWARNLTASSIGAGVRLSGPTLFGTPNNAKYVVAYRYNPPQRID